MRIYLKKTGTHFFLMIFKKGSVEGVGFEMCFVGVVLVLFFLRLL